MTKHNGFHLGNYATWDPRSDATILYTQEINHGKEKFHLPIFDKLVQHHEFSHRYFFKTIAVSELVSHSEFITSILVNEKRLEEYRPRLAGGIAFQFSYMDNIGSVLDLAHIFLLYMEYKETNISLEQLLKFAAIILDNKTKSILEHIVWLSNNQQEWKRIVLDIINFSLSYHYLDLVVKEGKKNHLYPTEILFNIFDTLHTLYDSNSKKAQTIIDIFPAKAHANAQEEYPIKYKLILSQLANYNHYLMDILDGLNFDFKKIRGLYETLNVYKLQGDEFLGMEFIDIMQQKPALVISENIDNTYSIFPRKFLSVDKFLLFLFQLAYAHLQECILYNNAELECYLCKIGICQRKEKYITSWSDNHHNIIKNIGKVLR